MPSLDPHIVLRLGSHAEKEYFEKTIQFFDGIIIGANLLEASPGATSSLLVRYGGMKQKIPYMIDPMTYAFGVSLNSDTREPLTDLSWLKSEQKKDGKVIFAFKRSYLALAKQYGGVFSDALRSSTSITGTKLSSALLPDLCKSVINYQLTRVKTELEKDEELKKLIGTLAPPSVVFTPYFYIPHGSAKKGLAITLELARASVAVANGQPIHAVVCADHDLLLNDEFVEELLRDMPGTGVKGIWFWFSKLHEDQAEERKLLAFRKLVSGLNNSGLEVGNFHGGYFSLALSKSGMKTVSHGVGYGEQKDVVPVIGLSTPTVRYYLPATRRRLGVPDIELCFRALNVKTPDDFHREICNCVVCRGVIGDSLSNFSEFGVRHFSSDEAKRMSQTPAAAKRCRFHFLLTRIAERNSLKRMTLAQITTELANAHTKWNAMPSDATQCDYLLTWKNVLNAAV